MRRLLIPLFLALTLPSLAFAQPLPIDQTCAEVTGCFPGDDPGFPVTITQPGEYVLASDLFNDVSAGWTIDALTNAVEIDMAGHFIDGYTPLDVANGVRGGAVTLRNGSFHGVGFVADGAVLVEDVVASTWYAGISSPNDTVFRRVRLMGSNDYVLVQCDHCDLQDVTIVSDPAVVVSATSASLERVSISANTRMTVSGAATILDSTIGGFQIGHDSVIRNTDVRCNHSASSYATARDRLEVTGSTVAESSPGRCTLYAGTDAHLQGNHFQEIDTGARAFLDDNVLDFTDSDRFAVVGPDSIVKFNALSVSATHARYRLGFDAGDGSEVRNNTIDGVSDGIICGEDCIVTGNTITNYTGTAISLGLTSVFCKNTIDGSGVAGIVGGIACDAAGVPSQTPGGLLTLALGLMLTAVVLGGHRIQLTRSADGQA
ncbi:MAG: hypothetical protein R3F16_09490 [Myxococcota bacterium]